MTTIDPCYMFYLLYVLHQNAIDSRYRYAISCLPAFPVTDWLDIKGFTWEKYLAQTKSQSVPARAFKTVSEPLWQ